MVSTEYDREVCIMQNAETVLNVTRERGERELPLENIYRLLCNPGTLPEGLRPSLLKPGGR